MRCENFPWRGLLFGASHGTIEGCTCIAWSSTIMTDLETKAEKYKTKAAQCEEWALQAPVGAVRNAVGIRFGAFSENMKVSFQATRSIG
jgi:hypothetical protein